LCAIRLRLECLLSNFKSSARNTPILAIGKEELLSEHGEPSSIILRRYGELRRPTRRRFTVDPDWRLLI